tara:strand:+ start:304 stop:447 length:144 start_codon:yes stop_codon:yes gene_type:complete
MVYLLMNRQFQACGGSLISARIAPLKDTHDRVFVSISLLDIAFPEKP